MKKCPYRFHLPEKKQGCIQHECEFYINIMGAHPQTGELVNDFRCSIAFLPILLVENSNQQRQTAHEVGKVANQIHRSRSEFIGALPPEARERIVQADLKILETPSEQGQRH